MIVSKGYLTTRFSCGGMVYIYYTLSVTLEKGLTNFKYKQGVFHFIMPFPSVYYQQ